MTDTGLAKQLAPVPIIERFVASVAGPVAAAGVSADPALVVTTALRTEYNGIALAEPIAKRIAAMMSFVNDTKGIYALNKIPLAVEWGKHFNANFGVKKGSNSRMLLWFVGQLDYHGTSKGDRLLTVNLSPLDGAELDKAAALQARLSQPTLKAADFKDSTIRLSHWQSNFGVQAEREVTENRLYDATDGFNKNSMPQLDMDAFKPGDIVLAEAHIHKYAQRDGTNKTGQTMASFDLVSLCMLHSVTEAQSDAYKTAKAARVKEVTSDSADIVL